MNPTMDSWNQCRVTKMIAMFRAGRNMWNFASCLWIFPSVMLWSKTGFGAQNGGLNDDPPIFHNFLQDFRWFIDPSVQTAAQVPDHIVNSPLRNCHVSTARWGFWFPIRMPYKLVVSFKKWCVYQRVHDLEISAWFCGGEWDEIIRSSFQWMIYLIITPVHFDIALEKMMVKDYFAFEW